jgi:hypothetical protein
VSGIGADRARVQAQDSAAASSAAVASTQPPVVPSARCSRFQNGARESGLAVGRGGDHQHDALARAHEAVAVDHPHGLDRPAGARFLDHAADLRFRHARIMLQLQGGEAPALVAAEPREGHDRTGAAHQIRFDAGDLGGGVEGLGLDADRIHRTRLEGPCRTTAEG